MSVEAIDSHITEVLTLDGLAVMNAADTHGYRYEMSPEGALSVMPPADFRHAQVVNRVTAWLLAAGWTLEQVYQAVGLEIAGPIGVLGGRIPDLVVWSRPPVPRAGWMPVTGVALVVEVISPSSRATDTKVKLDEYARAGIRRYWTVDCDAAHTVTMHELSGDAYVVRDLLSLDRVLDTAPSDHLN